MGLDEDDETTRVHERHVGEVDDDVVTVGVYYRGEAFSEHRRGSHVNLAADPNDNFPIASCARLELSQGHLAHRSRPLREAVVDPLPTLLKASSD